MEPRIRALLEAAMRAPSGDNTQPWRFLVDESAGSIQIELDPSRDPSPMNAGQRMARIAIGAAGESMVLRAEKNHWPVTARATMDAFGLEISLDSSDLAGDRPMSDGLDARVTNRRVYDGGTLDSKLLDRLKEMSIPNESTRTAWIVDRDSLTRMAGLIARADALMFGEPSMRRAFLANIRFDKPPTATVEEGLSLGSLELSATDRVALPLIGRLPEFMIRWGQVPKIFSKHAQRLVESASGLCVILAEDQAPLTDFSVGRRMLRAWMTAMEEGLSVQPMMSLPVLANAMNLADRPIRDRLERSGVPSLLEEVNAELKSLGDGLLAWIMRVGFAPPPTSRTGRRPLDEMVTVNGQASLRESPGKPIAAMAKHAEDSGR